MQRHIFISFAAGAVFAIGLGVGGMTLPTKVIGFLDVTGEWDPSLAFVMAGAVAVYSLAFWLVARRRRRPFADTKFHLPTRRDIDARLVGGAALFGAGWGLGGYCPGPALTSVANLSASAVIFVVAMSVGMLAFTAYERFSSRASARGNKPLSVLGESHAS